MSWPFAILNKTLNGKRWLPPRDRKIFYCLGPNNEYTKSFTIKANPRANAYIFTISFFIYLGFKYWRFYIHLALIILILPLNFKNRLKISIPSEVYCSSGTPLHRFCWSNWNPILRALDFEGFSRRTRLQFSSAYYETDRVFPKRLNLKLRK